MKYIVLLLLPFQLLAQNIKQVRIDIDSLCSDRMNGRGYVLDGDKYAAAYIKTRMEKIGLSAFTSGYYQEFPLSANTFPNNITVKVDGEKLVTGRDFIPDAACSPVSGKFKLVVVDSAMLSKPEQFLKINTAKKALFVKRDAEKKLFNKSEEILANKAYSFPFLITENEKLTHSYAPVQSGKKIICLKGKVSEKNKKIEVDIQPKLLQNYTSQNVIGYQKGSVYPDSFVVITAHYDHLGSIGNEAIFRGASDNASGVAFMLSLAEYYVQNPQWAKYSMVFIAFGGEESGLIGSKFFTENPLFPLSKISLLLNFDLMGTGDEGVTVVNATVFKGMFERLKLLNEKEKHVAVIKPRGKTAHSDHHYFTEKGVRSYFIYTIKGGPAYHDINDIPSSIPLQGYENCFRLMRDWVNNLP